MAGGWASLGLLDELVRAVEEDFDWLLPTAIQDEAIPLILGGGDVLASAETGSGKTAAFALPIVQLCAELKERTAAQAEENKSKKAKLQHLSQAAWSMSALDRDRLIAFKPESDGLIIQSRDPSRWAGCRARLGVSTKSSSKIMSFQCKILDEGGIVRLGWSTADATLQLGTDKDGWGFGSSGVKVWKAKYDPYPGEGASFGIGDVIGCHLQFTDENAVISYSKNGEWLGEAFKIKISEVKGITFYPAVCLKNSQCGFYFSSSSLPFPLPSDYVALASLRNNEVESNPRDTCASATDNAGPLAIIIEPTRDLAEQTYRVFDSFCKSVSLPKLSAALLVGGINPKDTVDRLKRNQVDILVGTPPILASYMKKGTVPASCGRFFVLDEADELIGNEETVKDIKSIYGRLLAASSKSDSRFDGLQVCFFSATLENKQVQELASAICNRPTWIKLRQNDSIFPETVHHLIVEVSPVAFDPSRPLIKTDAVHRGGDLNKPVTFEGLAENEIDSEKIKQKKIRIVVEIIEKFNMDQVLIFCRTNLDCDLLEAYLRSLSSTGGKGLVERYSCAVLAGMRSMEERKKSLQSFKEGAIRILIATDVAARGIDIKELPFIINTTLPDTPEIYVHRCGRVGRASRIGLAISFVSSVKERVWFCQKGLKPPCSDTRDYKNGGNCIWYDEPQFLKNLESLMTKNQIQPTKITYPLDHVPDDIKRILDSKGYGGIAAEPVDEAMSAKLHALQNQIKDVEATESALQLNYWELRGALNRVSTILREP